MPFARQQMALYGPDAPAPCSMPSWASSVPEQRAVAFGAALHALDPATRSTTAPAS